MNLHTASYNLNFSWISVSCLPTQFKFENWIGIWGRSYFSAEFRTALSDTHELMLTSNFTHRRFFQTAWMAPDILCGGCSWPCRARHVGAQTRQRPLRIDGLCKQQVEGSEDNSFNKGHQAVWTRINASSGWCSFMENSVFIHPISTPLTLNMVTGVLKTTPDLSWARHTRPYTGHQPITGKLCYGVFFPLVNVVFQSQPSNFPFMSIFFIACILSFFPPILACWFLHSSFFFLVSSLWPCFGSVKG